MSNIHTLSSLSTGSGGSGTSRSTPGSGGRSRSQQVGGTVYHTISAGEGLIHSLTSSRGGGAVRGRGRGRGMARRGGGALGNVRQLSSITAKLSRAIGSGQDTTLDVELRKAARQKQQIDVPMTPDIRMHAYAQKETVKPERGLTCPSGHKLSSPAVKKALKEADHYACPECQQLCGGEDVHPLHLEIRHLSPLDKNKYVDSVRWLSDREVDLQSRAYIRGHPQVFPHLAEGVLFHDETDAWKGYVLAWNIVYWKGDIAKYWEHVWSNKGRAEEEEEEEEEVDVKQYGRGKRKKRKLPAFAESKEEEEEEEVWEKWPEEDEEDATAAAATPESKQSSDTAAAASSPSRKRPKTASTSSPSSTSSRSPVKGSKAASSLDAAAASSSSSPSSSATTTKDREIIDIE